MEQNELHLLHSLLAKKEVLTTSSYFTVIRKDMVAIYRGAVVQNIFLSASSVNGYVQQHDNVAKMLQKSEKPIVLFCNAQNEPLKHYVFDNETRERIDQFRKLLDPLCKPKAINYEMSAQLDGTYIELKDKDNLLLGAGSYKGDVETIREQVQSDFACYMEIDPDLLAQMEVVAPAETQEKKKPWVKLFLGIE